VGKRDKMVEKWITKTEYLKKIPKEFFYLSTKYILEKTSKLARDVFLYGPGSWQALRTIYENDPESFLEWLLYPVTLGLEGSKDTRNRLNIYLELIENILEGEEIGEDCRYLDLACGCSLAPIKAAKYMKRKKENLNIRIKCSDIKKDAIQYSKKIANKERVSHLIDFEVYSIGKVDNIEPPEYYDGVGTHGFIDYKTPQESIHLFRKIKNVMKPRATLITSNMKKKYGFDLTRFMMRFYGNWIIKYKTREELGNILCDAGFDEPNILETPLGHHYVATAKKPL